MKILWNTYISIHKVILQQSHSYVCMYVCIVDDSMYVTITVKELQKRPYGPQNLKYLIFDPFQDMFADLCIRKLKQLN